MIPAMRRKKKGNNPRIRKDSSRASLSISLRSRTKLRL